MPPLGRFVPPTAFAVVVATALAAAVALPAARAERTDAFVPLGGTAALTVESPGDTASVGFLVQKGDGKKLSIKVKPAKKSPLALDVVLIDPDGRAVDVASIGGKVKASTKQVLITLPNSPAAGLWRVAVRGAAGTAGACTVQVKGKDATVLKNVAHTVPAGGSRSVEFDVGSNQSLTLTVKRAKGAAIVPRMILVDPSGNPLADGAFLGVSNAKKGTVTLKAFRLPVFGRYRLVISGEGGTGGGVTVTATTAPAKPVKSAPVASAGAPTDAERKTVKTLDGTGSTPGGGGLLSYVWTQVGGPPVQLFGATTATPSFTAPDAETSLAFELAVATGGVWSAPAPVTVEVGDRPLADAGRSLAVPTAAAVTLDGSKSIDRRGAGLRYLWRQDPADAVQVTLTGADTAAPTFTAPAAPAVLRFGLTVDDGSLRSAEDVVVVRAGDTAQPTPDAGRTQIVPRMATVHLSALATIPGTGILGPGLSWSQVSGPAVTLSDTTSPWPAFTAPKQSADLVFQLTSGGVSDRVRVQVRPSETNLAPVTRSTGTQFAASGDVTIDASPSLDPESKPLGFRWAQVAGPALAPSAADVKAPVVALPAGNESRVYAVQASDAFAYGPPELVSVRNTGYAGLPVANAGADQTVQSFVTVTLDGRASARTQGDGGIIYRWRQVSGTDWFDVRTGPVAFDPASSTPSFRLPPDLSSLSKRRTLSFELVVNDGAQDSVPDLVTVTLLDLPENGKPLVTAGASTTTPLPGQQVVLQGTTSDRDGDPVTVTWTQVSGPLAVTLVGGNKILTPSFTAPASGTFSFRLVGNDGFDDSAPATVDVSVDAAPTAVLTLTPNTGIPGTPATISGTQSSDPEGKPLTFTLTQVSGPTATVTPSATTPGVWTFNAPASSVSFRLVVNDGRQSSAPAQATFTVGSPVTAAPSASLSQAPYGGTVTLNANASGTGPFTYVWSQLTSGANANDPVVGSLSGTTSASASFQVPTPTSASGFGKTPSATFQVVVSNGPNSDTKTVKVNFFASFNDKGNAGLSNSDKVYGIIASGCMGSTCHSGTSSGCSKSVGYGMGNASAFRTNSINVGACSGGKQRVDTSGGSGSSNLIDRLKGVGGLMPQGGGSLPTGQIGLIADWIDQGALDN